jgi:methionyl-tRNA formyltransferase
MPTDPADRPTRVVFLSSAPLCVPALSALLADPRYCVVGLVTAPDRPAGRGRKVALSEIKRLALGAGLPVLQPARLRTPEAIEEVRALSPDLIVVAAYGQWIPADVFDMPPLRSINIHPSLLPRHRGAAPAMSAILGGDAVTGVTIIQVVEEMDAGDILAQESQPVDPADTTATLMDKLARLGADLLMRTLPDYVAGRILPRRQDTGAATWFGRIRKDAGRIDWSEPAVAIERKVRAYQPWPTAFTELDGQPMRVLEARVLPRWGEELPGTVLEAPEGPSVATGDGALLLLRVQPAGKKEMSGADLARGRRGFVGMRLGTRLGQGDQGSNL